MTLRGFRAWVRRRIGRDEPAVDVDGRDPELLAEQEGYGFTNGEDE